MEPPKVARETTSKLQLKGLAVTIIGVVRLVPLVGRNDFASHVALTCWSVPLEPLPTLPAGFLQRPSFKVCFFKSRAKQLPKKRWPWSLAGLVKSETWGNPVLQWHPGSMACEIRVPSRGASSPMALAWPKTRAPGERKPLVRVGSLRTGVRAALFGTSTAIGLDL